MKPLFLALISLLSFSAFAEVETNDFNVNDYRGYYCRVEMLTRDNRMIQAFESRDCNDAYRQCDWALNERQRTGRNPYARCEIVDNGGYDPGRPPYPPGPGPGPRPPYPPGPGPGPRPPYPPPPPPQVEYVYCGHDISSVGYCAVGGNVSSVNLYQVTGGNCIQGASWGYDHGNIWVRNCFATFQVNRW